MESTSPTMTGVNRRLATIEGQLKGIERLLQKDDALQVLTQSTAVRNALESVVRVLLQASIAGRFAVEAISERPDEVFERGLERAMTYWLSADASGPTIPLNNGTDFRVAAQLRIRAIQDRLRDVGCVLDGQNYLQALRELGAIYRGVDELVSFALSRFVKDRVGETPDSGKVRSLFDRTVEQALKYWRLPDPGLATTVTDKTNRKILVVDDDPDTVDYLRHILQRHDYQVVTAVDAEEAMSQVEAEKPDMIILDVMMPKGIEGFQFTWRLRSRPEAEYRNIPIIVLTSLHETTSLRFDPNESDGLYGPGEYLPVEGFIDKPAKEEELLQRVARVLRVAKGE